MCADHHGPAEEATATVTEDMRGSDGQAAFGPAQAVPNGASPADRLAAFPGRSVETSDGRPQSPRG